MTDKVLSRHKTPSLLKQMGDRRMQNALQSLLSYGTVYIRTDENSTEVINPNEIYGAAMGIVERMRDERWLAIPTMDVVVMVRTAADLIERLKGYAVHAEDCDINQPFKGVEFPPCSCGLAALIKEIDGE